MRTTCSSHRYYYFSCLGPCLGTFVRMSMIKLMLFSSFKYLIYLEMLFMAVPTTEKVGVDTSTNQLWIAVVPNKEKIMLDFIPSKHCKFSLIDN